MSKVTEIRYIGDGVPDLIAERSFYAEKWGLNEVEIAWGPGQHAPSPLVMDQRGIDIAVPQTMPHPAPDAGLFQPMEG